MPSLNFLPEALVKTRTPAGPSTSLGRHGGKLCAAADGLMRE
jgi:hypothetical protein